MPPTMCGIPYSSPVFRFWTLLAAHVRAVELDGFAVCSISGVRSLHLVPSLMDACAEELICAGHIFVPKLAAERP